MLCDSCRLEVLERLTGDDLFALEALRLKKATIPQRCLTRDAILTEADLSVHQVREAILKLTVTGLVKAIQNGRATGYYLTPDGRRMLADIVQRERRNVD